MESREAQFRYADKAREANFALWNALLTVNGLVLGGAALLVTLAPGVSRAVPLAIVGGAAMSMLLLIWNFLADKSTYMLIGQRLDPTSPDVPPEEMERDVEASLARHRATRMREIASILLLAAEVALLTFYVIEIPVT